MSRGFFRYKSVFLKNSMPSSWQLPMGMPKTDRQWGLPTSHLISCCKSGLMYSHQSHLQNSPAYFMPVSFSYFSVILSIIWIQYIAALQLLDTFMTIMKIKPWHSGNPLCIQVIVIVILLTKILSCYQTEITHCDAWTD